MAYTTVAEVRVATGFSDDEKILDATITEYIAEADLTIDGFVYNVYALPFSSTPPLVSAISRHIAVGLLYANEYGEESQGTDKGWKNRMDWAIEQLNRIQKKELKLVKSDGTEYETKSLGSIGFSPTDATSAAGEADEPRLTMKKVF